MWSAIEIVLFVGVVCKLEWIQGVWDVDVSLSKHVMAKEESYGQ